MVLEHVWLNMIVYDWPHWLSYHHCHAVLTPGVNQTDRTAQGSRHPEDVNKLEGRLCEGFSLWLSDLHGTP